jgi:hypothetical protein
MEKTERKYEEPIDFSIDDSKLYIPATPTVKPFTEG